MHRPIRLLSAAAVLLAASAAGPLAADATQHGLRLTPGRVAHVGHAGMQVRWPVLVRCPRGQRYVLEQIVVIQRNPPRVPELRGEDEGVTATARALPGRCTGQVQHRLVVLTVRPTTFVDDETGRPVTRSVPMTAAEPADTSAQVVLSLTHARRGPAPVVFCAAPNCAEETGPRIRLVAARRSTAARARSSG